MTVLLLRTSKQLTKIKESFAFIDGFLWLFKALYNGYCAYISLIIGVGL
jgi:hypothetical protein